jgi:adenylate kinase
VYLSISEEETISRLSARRINKTTGEIYNMITNPPPADVTSEDLIHRDDDQPESIKKRLLAYHADTEPLLVELRKTTQFIEVNGLQTIESSFRNSYYSTK